MKNLEHYNVSTLETKDLENINGGGPSLLRGALHISAEVSHSIVDFVWGALDRFNMFR